MTEKVKKVISSSNIHEGVAVVVICGLLGWAGVTISGNEKEIIGMKSTVSQGIESIKKAKLKVDKLDETVSDYSKDMKELSKDVKELTKIVLMQSQGKVPYNVTVEVTHEKDKMDND